MSLRLIHGTPLILHVEDNQAQSDALRRILEQNGFAVLQANTG
jgi:DNA-binding response OmpR family regulator